MVIRITKINNALAALIIPLLFSCGTHVDSGQNVKKAKESLSNESQNGTGSSGGGNGSSTSGGGGGQNGGNVMSLTCFGPSTQIADYIQTFCSNIDAQHKAQFATAVKMICDEHKLITLFQKECAWTGDTSNENNFIRILESTNVADASTQDYYYLGAFSLIANSTLDQLQQVLFAGYLDPNYTAKYSTIPNSKILEAHQIGPDQLVYHLTLSTSSSTAEFKGQIDVVKYSPKFRVAFDYSTEGIQLLKTHRYLAFYLDRGDNTSSVVVIDEKKIDDGGNHTLAKSTTYGVDHKRMEIIYQNALRD